MNIINKDDCFVVNISEELLTALNNKETYILITKSFKEDFEKLHKFPFLKMRKSDSWWDLVVRQVFLLKSFIKSAVYSIKILRSKTKLIKSFVVTH